MSSVYPRAAVEKVVVPMDPDVLAARVIDARETNPRASKAHLVGGVLQGSNDVAGFERAWDAVEHERLSMAAVRVADHDTATSYADALEEVSVYLSVNEYADGVMDAVGAATWADVKELDSAEL